MKKITLKEELGKQYNAEEITEGIIAIDNGGSNTKVFSESMSEPVSFGSKKAIGHERHKKEPKLPENLYSHFVEWEGKYYLTNYRTMQSRAQKTSLVDSKTDDFYILSLLIAVAKHGFDENYVATCVPFSRYTEEEVEAIQERLIGTHTLVLDGDEYIFEIKDVTVLAETQVGFFHLKPMGKTRLLDIGSRTVGYATVFQNEDFYQPINDETGTIEREGLEIRSDASERHEYTEYVENLFYELQRVFEVNDEIIAFGGGALVQGITDLLKEKYQNLTVADDPLFVQVRGLLDFAKSIYRGEEHNGDQEERLESANESDNGKQPAKEASATADSTEE